MRAIRAAGRSVGLSDRVASFADRAPFFDHPQIPFAPSLTRLSKRFGDVMSAAAASPSFPSSLPFGGIMSEWLARKCHFSVTIKGQS